MADRGGTIPQQKRFQQPLAPFQLDMKKPSAEIFRLLDYWLHTSQKHKRISIFKISKAKSGIPEYIKQRQKHLNI